MPEAKTATATKVAAAGTVLVPVITHAVYGDAKPCPPVNWSSLPRFTRDSLAAFMFGATCLPGTATNTGCRVDQTVYTIVVPWDRFTAEGWTAPGGNRYWAAPRISAPL